MGETLRGLELFCLGLTMALFVIYALFATWNFEVICGYILVTGDPFTTITPYLTGLTGFWEFEFMLYLAACVCGGVTVILHAINYFQTWGA